MREWNMKYEIYAWMMRESDMEYMRDAHVRSICAERGRSTHPGRSDDRYEFFFNYLQICKVTYQLCFIPRRDMRRISCMGSNCFNLDIT